MIGLTAFLYGVAAFLAVYAIKAPVYVLPPDEFERDPFDDTEEQAPVRPTGVFDRLVRPILRDFLPQAPLAAVAKAHGNSKTQELLIRAGNPWNLRPEEFVALRMVAALGGFLALMLLALGGFLPTMVPVAGWMAIGAVLGAWLPKVLLDGKRGKRRKEATRGLPEALDLLVITLNSGMNFVPALNEVIDRLPHGLIRSELTDVAADLNAGKSLLKALDAFARRAPSPEVESFCKSVVQAERLGSDVSTTLTAQAKAARTAYEADMEQRSGKLQTTLFFPVIGLMTPALMATLFAPALANIAQVF